ncbi:VOC family protein [Nioella aestuarii]|uniref:VOC family protein n=1 Tax=Nioella aestuarii TaxID=1662864 RepID=UPI003D7FCC55
MSYLVNAMGHVQLNVMDVDALVRESVEILGLRVTREEAGCVWLSSNGRMAELVLHEAGENSMRALGFEAVSEAAVAEAAARVADAGCRLISSEPSLDCCVTGMTFVTPQGHTIELHSPVATEIYGNRHPTTGMAPLRIDHVNITSPEPAETRAQMEAIMGMRLSERMVDDGLSWMRGANRLHHILGIVKGETGLHHYSWEVAEFSDYCTLGDRLDTIEKNFIWGPGRHRPGDNTFAYYIDTCGAMVECAGNMALINDDDRYEPNVITALKRPDNVRVMNVWGEPAPLPWREHRFPWAAPLA